MENKIKKLITDIREADMNLIDHAAAIEKRTRSSFIKIAALEKAKQVILKNGNRTES